MLKLTVQKCSSDELKIFSFQVLCCLAVVPILISMKTEKSSYRNMKKELLNVLLKQSGLTDWGETKHEKHQSLRGRISH